MENFIHLFNSGGFVMYPLLLLSVITLAIAVERFSSTVPTAGVRKHFSMAFIMRRRKRIGPWFGSSARNFLRR